MKLFLCSYFKKVHQLLTNFLGDFSGKSVCWIPTAAIPEEFKHHLIHSKESFANLGIYVVELDVHTASYDEIDSKLTNCDLIFVAGGNTFFLLQELKRSKTDQVIR